MPIINLENPSFISVDGAGRPNAGGTVGVYVAGTSFATLATIYSDQVKTTELTNPITMDDAGTKEIWYDVKVDILEKTKTGVLIRDTLNLDPNAAAVASTSFNLAPNGSFEIDSDTDGQPDNWTISPYSGSDIAITSTVVTNGVKALEFNTAAAGVGGGTATSTKFPVTEGSIASVNWSFFATHATTLNTFQIKWYDHLDVLQSTSTVTMPASGSVPTSWTEYTDEVTVDAAGTQGEIVLTGISSGGSNLSSKAYFDGIIITNQKVTNLRGSLSAEPIIYDSNGNEIIETGKVASAVNQLKVTNSATGNPITLSVEGETDKGIDFNSKDSEEMLRLRATAAAVNEITITSSATGNRPTISSSGEADIGINFENDQGEELLELIPVASAVNNVRITNAITTAAAVIDCSETNSDLEFTRNGTGEITVDATPIYGLVILDTPEEIVVSTLASAVWTTVNSTTLNTANAVKAIIKVVASVSIASATSVNANIYLRKTGSALAITNQTLVCVSRGQLSSAGSISVLAANEVVVNLDSSGDFDYYYSPTGGLSSDASNIYLIGYYV